jgi:hypothetical protein
MEQVFGKLTHIKNNLLSRFAERDFSKARERIAMLLGKKRDQEVSPNDIHIDNYHYESHRVDDLPLTIIKDPGPGIKYSYTENSEFARGAEKTEAVGIDKFGDEEDTFDIEAADDYQDFRNRNQNSDLSKRFYTDGLNIDAKDLDH